MNPLLESIATQASEDLKHQFADANKDIMDAIQKAESEAVLQGIPLKFNIGFKIALDFDKGAFECALSWNVRQTLSRSHKIEDPNQRKLPIEETKMTIKAAGTEVNTTLEKFSEAVKKITKSKRA